MASISSNLINNLSESEGVHIIKCKFGYDDKKCETCGSIATVFSNAYFLKMI